MGPAYNSGQYTDKGSDGDEYAPYSGTESRRTVKSLPAMATPNGPPSCEAKGRKPKYLNRVLPLSG